MFQFIILLLLAACLNTIHAAPVVVSQDKTTISTNETEVLVPSRRHSVATSARAELLSQHIADSAAATRTHNLTNVTDSLIITNTTTSTLSDIDMINDPFSEDGEEEVDADEEEGVEQEDGVEFYPGDGLVDGIVDGILGGGRGYGGYGK